MKILSLISIPALVLSAKQVVCADNKYNGDFLDGTKWELRVKVILDERENMMYTEVDAHDLNALKAGCDANDCSKMETQFRMDLDDYCRDHSPFMSLLFAFAPGADVFAHWNSFYYTKDHEFLEAMTCPNDPDQGYKCYNDQPGSALFLKMPTARQTTGFGMLDPSNGGTVAGWGNILHPDRDFAIGGPSLIPAGSMWGGLSPIIATYDSEVIGANPMFSSAIVKFLDDQMGAAEVDIKELAILWPRPDTPPFSRIIDQAFVQIANVTGHHMFRAGFRFAPVNPVVHTCASNTYTGMHDGNPWTLHLEVVWDLAEHTLYTEVDLLQLSAYINMCPPADFMNNQCDGLQTEFRMDFDDCDDAPFTSLLFALAPIGHPPTDNFGGGYGVPHFSNFYYTEDQAFVEAMKCPNDPAQGFHCKNDEPGSIKFLNMPPTQYTTEFVMDDAFAGQTVQGWGNVLTPVRDVAVFHGTPGPVYLDPAAFHWSLCGANTALDDSGCRYGKWRGLSPNLATYDYQVIGADPMFGTEIVELLSLDTSDLNVDIAEAAMMWPRQEITPFSRIIDQGFIRVMHPTLATSVIRSGFRFEPKIEPKIDAVCIPENCDGWCSPNFGACRPYKGAEMYCNAIQQCNPMSAKCIDFMCVRDYPGIGATPEGEALCQHPSTQHGYFITPDDECKEIFIYHAGLFECPHTMDVAFMATFDNAAVQQQFCDFHHAGNNSIVLAINGPANLQNNIVSREVVDFPIQILQTIDNHPVFDANWNPIAFIPFVNVHVDKMVYDRKFSFPMPLSGDQAHLYIVFLLPNGKSLVKRLMNAPPTFELFAEATFNLNDAGATTGAFPATWTRRNLPYLMWMYPRAGETYDYKYGVVAGQSYVGTHATEADNYPTVEVTITRVNYWEENVACANKNLVGGERFMFCDYSPSWANQVGVDNTGGR